MYRAFILLMLCSAGCAGAPKSNAVSVDPEFDCNGRRVSYDMTGGFGAAAQGIAVSCEGNAPVLARYRQVEADGPRKAIEHQLSSSEFDLLWEKIETTGWRNFEQCPDRTNDSDPEYEIKVADSASDVAVTCSGKKLEFPYGDVVNELELKAAALGGQLR